MCVCVCVCVCVPAEQGLSVALKLQGVPWTWFINPSSSCSSHGWPGTKSESTWRLWDRLKLDDIWVIVLIIVVQVRFQPQAMPVSGSHGLILIFLHIWEFSLRIRENTMCFSIYSNILNCESWVGIWFSPLAQSSLEGTSPPESLSQCEESEDCIRGLDKMPRYRCSFGHQG